MDIEIKKQGSGSRSSFLVALGDHKLKAWL